ncbi:Aminoglycoside/hydroxyurea antibiotic resistance kinase [Legionella steigerwaltii]|uniref:Aminoglycoside/hydroxyurea antibiotic resistance kinase n=1 Tax=Legionella steigerwaltii TaxID=460 RepID=A0A378LDB7_9GAMM|nr:aminoglycoside phosphotransferase family protein [Legionella steigerwaltii]KTD71700.1 Aminoglycoside/hydroxyurea antibiotic resistance kinase [Legionella steigerwaltii]STY23868.1 Aminoglycoside/hydroxyurea antibiotic resistance kinase [Legionella steigerwaltii]
MNLNDIFNKYLKLWHLTQDGDPIITNTSRLLPVSHKGSSAMLKIALSNEERNGGALMVWWEGEGAARIFEYKDDALLMERAVGKRSLVCMTKTGQDDEASKIICDVVSRLHAKNKKPLPATLVPLTTWFRSLHSAAIERGGIFTHAARVARELLQNPQETVVLHGDIHHQNILDSGTHGWIAIDPKGLLGERGFDYANIFCNPDWDIAARPGRLARQATVVAEAAGLERSRLMKWILAYAGLSAAWSLEDGDSPDLALFIANVAKTELEESV